MRYAILLMPLLAACDGGTWAKIDRWSRGTPEPKHSIAPVVERRPIEECSVQNLTSRRIDLLDSIDRNRVSIQRYLHGTTETDATLLKISREYHEGLVKELAAVDSEFCRRGLEPPMRPEEK